MSNEKKSWPTLPLPIIIEEEQKRRREQIERQRPRIELPIYSPNTSSYDRNTEQEVEKSTIITFKL